MDLLQKKRERDISNNDSNASFKEKILTYFDILNRDEIELDENPIFNINNNDSNDNFKKIFKNTTSRKESIFQNNILISPSKNRSSIKNKSDDIISFSIKKNIYVTNSINNIENESLPEFNYYKDSEHDLIINENASSPNSPKSPINVSKIKNNNLSPKILINNNECNNNAFGQTRTFTFSILKKKIGKKKHKKSTHNSKEKVTKKKIFHIEKILNKNEDKDGNEKVYKRNKTAFLSTFRISLEKIKQIFINSCLKLYLYLDQNASFTKFDLRKEEFTENVRNYVFKMMVSKKLDFRKMNDILQINDDYKYRAHYFSYTSEAKKFCLSLVKEHKLSFVVVAKMCRIPKRNLRRWFLVGSERIKGSGAKTKYLKTEEKLFEWYKINKNKGVIFNGEMLRNQAKIINDDKAFRASRVWLNRFKKKYNIDFQSKKGGSLLKKSISNDINKKE